MAATTRQTQTFLRNLFQERGLHPKNKLGQNFLIDLNLLEVAVRHAELAPTDLVLEVGTGTGSLTARLAELAGAVLSVEVDRQFSQLAAETLGYRPHVRLVEADILKNKNQLNPEVVEQLHKAWATGQFTKLKLVSNLPYSVATPVMSNLLLSDLVCERMVVMVQWEIAEKLASAPNTKEYGALSVLVQALADVEIVRRLPPAAFWPRPQVDSAIVCVRPSAEKRSRVADPTSFRHFLRDLYSHRRKNLRGALLAIPTGSRDKAHIDALLASLALDSAVRAETLTVEQHLALWQAHAKEFTH